MQTTSNYLNRINFEGKEQSIFYILYKPDKDAKATLLMLHGIQEHSGRYREVAEFMAKRGFVVLTYDHIGHGQTAKTESERGFFQLDNPDGQLVHDAGVMTDYLHSLYPELHHFILGHSMGSFVLRVFLQKRSGDFKAAVIVGTGAKVPGIAFSKAFLALLNTIAPNKRSKFVNGIFGKMNNQKFRKELGADATSWLSLSKNNRKSFSEDPLNGIPFTNNGFYTLVNINQRATAADWAQSIDRNFSIMFISGAEDPIGDFGKGIRKTVLDLERMDFTEISTQIYPEMRHEILNEDIREKVFKDILVFLESHK